MKPTRRAFLRTLLAAPFVGAAVAQDRKPPVTGNGFPGLASFDELMTTFLVEQKVPGAALALAKDGQLVYARGFGYADPDARVPVQPTSLFRIASVTKTITGVAVVKLAEQGKLGLDDRALDYLKNVAPAGKLDARWPKITIRHLLQHTAGWDRDKSGDVSGKPGEVANALRVPLPVTAAHIVRYLMTRPLDFDPGTKFVYSNPGYLVLGRIIEAVTGGTYEAFVKKEIFAPLGITTAQLGRELPENRARAEVRYFDRKKQKGACLYPPRRGQVVPVMDGAFNYEAHDSFGGWVASAVDLVRFASSFDDPEKCPILKAGSIATLWERPEGAAGRDGEQLKPTYYGCGWSYRPVTADRGNAWHEGLMPGSAAMLARVPAGAANTITWAVVFNTDLTLQLAPLSTTIEPLVGQAGGKVTGWPEKDLFPMYLK